MHWRFRGMARCAIVLGLSGLLGASLASAQRELPEIERGKYPPKPQGEVGDKREAVNNIYRQKRAETPTERLVYGADDRRDVYELLPAETLFQELQAAACVVVFTSEITNNGNGTYTLSTDPWLSQGGSLCVTEPFRGQLQIGFCSGFLVGSDIVVTAGHCVDAGDCGSVAFVFGFDQLGPSTPPNTVVSADNIYFCNNIINQQLAGDNDHSVIRLDRDVVGRNPIPIRHTGTVVNGDPLVMIGHPVVLPKKIDDGGIVKNANGAIPWFNANVDAYGGNSGSMVVNSNTGVIEGILVRGNPDFTTSGGCVVSNVCPDSGCPGWEEITKATSFATFVPELGMQVSPAGSVDHIGVVGGPFTNPTVVYTLSNPTNTPVNYQVHLGAGSAPMLLNGGASDVTGTLPASGGSANVTVTINASATGLAAGVYSRTIEFNDLSNGLDNDRPHTLEIGQTGFTVAPADGLTSGGPIGGPFSGTKVYTITSTRPTPVNVQVAASNSWISLNGGAGPVNLTLTGTGDSANVTVGFSAAANALPAGIANGTVNITNTSGGAGNTSRPVTLDVGRFTYPSGDTPIPINDLGSLTSSINITDDYCVGDVDVVVDITHTYIGDLIVELVSPSGTVVRLHDRTGLGDDNIMQTYDDVAMPPDGPGVLSDFNGEVGAGTWTLFVSDNAGQDVGTLNSWSLKIAANASVCVRDVAVTVPHTVTSPITLIGGAISGSLNYIITSLPANGTFSDPNGGVINSTPYTLLGGGNVVNYKPDGGYVGPDAGAFKVNNGADSNIANIDIFVGFPEVIYNFPLDTNPGWTTQGQWAFGHPTGGGSSGGDPTNGYTGTNVYGYNLGGDYANNLARQALTTTALDCTGLLNTTLEFRRHLGVESATYDHASVEVSNNGSSWTVIWNHTGESFNESSWSLQTFDISAVADNQPTVFVRWIMGTTDSSVTYPGWNIDDIRILGVPPAPPAPDCLGDLNGDNQVDITDLSILLSNFGTPSGAAPEDGDLDEDGDVDITDLSIQLGVFGTSC